MTAAKGGSKTNVWVWRNVSAYPWTMLADSVRDDIAFLNGHMKGYWAPAAAARTARMDRLQPWHDRAFW
jgi:hypothetical protein